MEEETEEILNQAAIDAIADMLEEDITEEDEWVQLKKKHNNKMNLKKMKLFHNLNKNK